ncbi:MAG TPA: mycofactocin biosynthesis chaperone MftB [Microbacteriaceae bacterium]|jgi:putative mycofactocin binding protein MftB|nr:mycofactocin biosynthesis chaperone MftB [Microbacteriaceae bacterium]HQX35332.1 mycofactocin biosynthesis chaperone MftB [Microbacteriaceae bacterium]HQZ47776.1 mycofactocin biosynthesis chaperone MftB [Microbacteriaceae bacterium]HRA08465.1 mycofactocin biosynthesis chaperone MftB [Microbacteriaceae bacterium]
MTLTLAESAWQLHPRVSVRPEPFGALLYHFGTRKLSFLKDRTLVALVAALGDAPTARAACDSVGIHPDAQTVYLRALETLATSNMIEVRAA